jgi:hypothetical protein
MATADFALVFPTKQMIGTFDFTFRAAILTVVFSDFLSVF